VLRSRIMSTLAEIEAAVSELPLSDLRELEGYVVSSRRRKERLGTFTGRDAMALWDDFEHLSPGEAEAFARDVEEGRRIVNQPPKPPEWE
jgi:hypothetical protein